MAVGTALSRLTGLARIFALSYALGVTPLADAYNLANTTPNMVYDLVLGGVLSATLVPLFVSRLRHGGGEADDEGWTAVSAVVTVSLVLLALATAVVAAAAGLLIRAFTAASPLATAGAQRTVAVRLLELFAAQVLLYGVVALATAVLNSLRRFALPMFAPIANNLVVIAILLALAGRLRHVGIDRVLGEPALLAVLGLGTTAGVATQAFVVSVGLRRAGARLRWRWQPGHPAVRQMLPLSGWTFAMTACNQASLFAVLMMADCQAGGVSAYTYAFAFFQLPVGVVTVSITGARQPSWAAAWQAGKVEDLRKQVSAGLRLLLQLMVPIATVLAGLAVPLVSLLLGYGATSPAGAALTGRVLAVLALGLPGFSAYLYIIRVYQALQELRSAFWLYLLNNGLIVILATLLYHPAGVEGIAAAGSLSYTVAAIAAAVLLRRRLGAAPDEPPMMPIRALIRAVAASVPAGVLAWLTVRSMGAPTGTRALLPLLGGTVIAVFTLYCLGGASLVPAIQTRLLRSRRAARALRNGSR
jgi:putative peptidoglycan lipid II flippase